MPASESGTPQLQALGRVVRELRERRRMSSGELAALTGIDETGLEALEAGRFDPTYGQLLALAGGLDVPLAEIFALAARPAASGGGAP